jgi:hypothetical protein
LRIGNRRRKKAFHLGCIFPARHDVADVGMSWICGRLSSIDSGIGNDSRDDRETADGRARSVSIVGSIGELTCECYRKPWNKPNIKGG